jgi:uncharacterized protein with HEPN domain
MCEALSLLPDRVKTRQLQIDWKEMVCLAARLRREYYYDNGEALLRMAKRNLPMLRVLAERLVQNSDGYR